MDSNKKPRYDSIRVIKGHFTSDSRTVQDQIANG